MTPLDFLRAYDSDLQTILRERASAPLPIEEGDRVGIVLFNLGGPSCLEQVEPFLYSLLMDPAFLDLPLGRRLRHWMAKSVAYIRAKPLRERYELIGGGSPLTRLAQEQAEALQGHLHDCYGESMGVDFRTYPAMRYLAPSPEDAAAQMAADEVDKVVLLPSYPQYSTATTGSALAYWQALADAGERPTWPTSVVLEYAANPKYVQAVSERIDEALQRFPRGVRDETVLVFSAHDSAFRTQNEHEDPFCCHVHSTVEQVMQHRNRDRPFRTAFQSMIGPNGWLTPSTPATLSTLADQGHGSVLVVPVTFVTGHLNTNYEIDVELRAEAEEHGIEHFEVTAGLNTHPLFIRALSEAALAQLDLPVDLNQLRLGGDGHSQTYPLRPLHKLPRHQMSGQSARCSSCGRTTGARKWRLPEHSAEPEVSSDRPASHPEDPSGPSPEPRSKEQS